jgi:hypothetical protein
MYHLTHSVREVVRASLLSLISGHNLAISLFEMWLIKQGKSRKSLPPTKIEYRDASFPRSFTFMNKKLS